MPNEEAEQYVRGEYATRADEWLQKLKNYTCLEQRSIRLNLDDIEELAQLFERALTVCKAAGGDRGAIEHLVYNKVDGLNLGMNHWATQLLAESLVGTLEDLKGENYVQVEFGGHPKGNILVTIQFRSKKTPADVAAERLKKIEDLELLLADKDAEIKELTSEIQDLNEELEQFL